MEKSYKIIRLNHNAVCCRLPWLCTCKSCVLTVKEAHLDLWPRGKTRSYKPKHTVKCASHFERFTHLKVRSFRAVTYRKVHSWSCVRAGRSTWRWSGYRWCSRLRHVTDARSRWRARSGRARSRRAPAHKHLQNSICKQYNQLNEHIHYHEDDCHDF